MAGQSNSHGPVLLCMGTRPEIIKMAPVAHALANTGQNVQIVHTGQHEGMAWPLYEFFDLHPTHRLSLDRSCGQLPQLAAQLLEGLNEVFERAHPQWVLVHGDTLSAHMAAQAAFMRRIPVAHVEAGLRSGQIDNPFPEEMNRQCIGRLASLHFAPTTQARQNLLSEGVALESTHVTGNTVVDAVHLGLDRLQALGAARAGLCPRLLAFLQQQAQQHPHSPRILVTAHRRENWGQGIHNIAQAVAQLLMQHPRLSVVWPMHANPAVQQDIRHGLGALSPHCARRLHLCEPLGYPDLLHTLQGCRAVLTDSGGIQEEAVTLQVPVLVLRETTERPEVIESGWGQLVGTQVQNIVSAAQQVLQAAVAPQACANPFGQGQAARAIANQFGNLTVSSKSTMQEFENVQ